MLQAESGESEAYENRPQNGSQNRSQNRSQGQPSQVEADQREVSKNDEFCIKNEEFRI